MHEEQCAHVVRVAHVRLNTRVEVGHIVSRLVCHLQEQVAVELNLIDFHDVSLLLVGGLHDGTGDELPTLGRAEPVAFADVMRSVVLVVLETTDLHDVTDGHGPMIVDVGLLKPREEMALALVGDHPLEAEGVGVPFTVEDGEDVFQQLRRGLKQDVPKDELQLVILLAATREPAGDLSIDERIVLEEPDDNVEVTHSVSLLK